MKTLTTLVLLGLCLVPAQAEEPALETEDAKTIYALGLVLAQRLAGFGLTPEEVVLVEAGLRDGLTGKTPRVELAEYGPKIDPLAQARVKAVADEERAAGVAFCEEAAKVEGAVKTESGAVYLETKAGTGAQPATTDTVRLHYHGTLRDGTVFDSSRGGDPAKFALNAVIPCFSEGVSRMKVGGTATLTCPSESAYGDRGSPPLIKPGAAIMFEVELVEVVTTPAP